MSTLISIGDPRPRLPEWLRTGRTHFDSLHGLKSGLRSLRLHTVCESARCPNIHECFHRGTATFMVLGNLCTRGCGFCSVPKGSPAKHDMRLDPEEPANVARMAAGMQLRHVVITSVNRDDLDDGGSAHFAAAIREVRRALPEARVEALVPDFCGDPDAVARILDAGPHIFNHNMETIERLYRRVRPQAAYQQSLDVLYFARHYRADVLTKSGLMAGLGEAPEEVEKLLRDLRGAEVDIATIGQYLQPTRRNLPVAAYIEPWQFLAWRDYGMSIGFKAVFSGPLVRSSYMADRVDLEARPDLTLNYALAVLSAALLVLAFPPFNLAFLAAIAAAPLLIAAGRETRPARRFLLGWITGILYWFGVCHWIQFVLSYHGGVGDPAGWALFLLFCLIKGLHMGVFALLAGILIRRWWAVPAVAALWVAVEATHNFLGFAWLTLGNAGSGMTVPLRLAPITGVYGLSFAFMMMATALALAALRRPRTELAWLLALFLLVLLPPVPKAEKGRESAVLLQPDISETAEWTRDSIDRMQRELVALSLQAVKAAQQSPALIAWPEVPAPLYYYDDVRFQNYVNGLARATGAWVLLGVVSHTPAGAPLNSAALVSPEGRPVSRYDKVNLVPFGEFVPWPFGGLAQHISSEVGDFAPGNRVVVSPVGPHKIGTFICYESVFPHFVRRFVKDGAEVLFNISNDGYFGHSAAREQHLEIVRMRAAENRRWILRSTNDGITAAIDPAGRVRGSLPLYIEAASHTGFSYLSEQTIYTRYGDWFPVLCAIAAAALLVKSRF